MMLGTTHMTDVRMTSKHEKVILIRINKMGFYDSDKKNPGYYVLGLKNYGNLNSDLKNTLFTYD